MPFFLRRCHATAETDHYLSAQSKCWIFSECSKVVPNSAVDRSIPKGIRGDHPFGIDSQREKGTVTHHARLTFMRESASGIRVIRTKPRCPVDLKAQLRLVLGPRWNTQAPCILVAAFRTSAPTSRLMNRRSRKHRRFSCGHGHNPLTFSRRNRPGTLSRRATWLIWIRYFTVNFAVAVLVREPETPVNVTV